MNISKHAMRRYAERYKNQQKGMELDQYVARERERLEEELNTMLDHAEPVFTGQLRGNVTRNYYYQQGSIIITDTQMTAIITVYKISYGFTPEIDRTIAEQLVNEIEESIKKEDKLREEVKPVVESLESSKETLESELEALREKLQDKKSQLANVNGLIEDYTKTLGETSMETIELTNKLVASKDFQEDLAAITGGK